jgi:hypothetical protein
MASGGARADLHTERPREAAEWRRRFRRGGGPASRESERSDAATLTTSSSATGDQSPAARCVIGQVRRVTAPSSASPFFLRPHGLALSINERSGWAGEGADLRSRVVGYTATSAVGTSLPASGGTRSDGSPCEKNSIAQANHRHPVLMRTKGKSVLTAEFSFPNFLLGLCQCSRYSTSACLEVSKSDAPCYVNL